ncbi:MAG TPA: hypothetical protein DCM40_04785, partial [Maribacter sp.]|nr:hypothetical protein [Maribacter sp.]
QFNRVVGDQDVRLVSRTGESFVDLDEKGNVVANASKDSGHQFLSLGVDGISKLQAKQEIHLAVRTDGAKSKPGEPYVLVSELENVLNEIIVTQNVIMSALVGIGAAA